MSGVTTPFPKTVSRLVGGFARRHWTAYALSAVMLTGVALLTVWLPRQVGTLVDGLAAGELAGEALLAELGLLVAAGIGIYGLRVAWRLRLYAASYRLGMELRTSLYRRLAAQGPAFFQVQRTGDLMALATNDVDAVELAAGEAMLAGFDGTLTLILVVAMMSLAIDARLALVTLAPFPLMAVAFWIISNKIHAASRDSLTRFSKLNDFTQETLSGVRTVRALGLETKTRSDFADLAEHAAEAGLAAQRWEAAYEPAVGITLALAGTLILGMGGWLVWQGELTVGALTAFSMYLVQLIWPMFAAGWVLSLLERGRAAWGRLEPVLNTPLAVVDGGSATIAGAAPLRFDGVSMRYPGQSAPALEDIGFTLAPGGTLGIVGATGAGKSSIVRLVLRQFAHDAGGISWDGRPLADYRLDSLRAALRWVPQEAFLFSASIADNIALGRPDATPAEIEQAARVAAIHDDILHFPQAYATPVGERGVTLSGGQRQRVAIARALIEDAPMLLLDDALSAVDTQTEAAILHHLRERRRQSAGGMIVISHRLSAVMEADEILVLAHGRVVERGTHDALLALGGWYAAQWRYQQLEASLETA